MSGPLIRSSGPPACGNISRHCREGSRQSFPHHRAATAVDKSKSISPAEKTIRTRCGRCNRICHQLYPRMLYEPREGLQKKDMHSLNADWKSADPQILDR